MTILFSGRKMLYRTKKKRRYNQGFWKWRYRHYNRIHKNIVIDYVKTWQPMTIFSLPKTAHICDIFLQTGSYPIFLKQSHTAAHRRSVGRVNCCYGSFTLNDEMITEDTVNEYGFGYKDDCGNYNIYINKWKGWCLFRHHPWIVGIKISWSWPGFS